MPEPIQDFYDTLPVVTSFSSLADPAHYVPVPAGWILGIADVVQSTAAIESGRYKAVNTAGASVIAAVANALGGTVRFPFSFGGDGASFVVSNKYREVATRALSQTAAWVRDDLDLSIRAALLPIADIRAAGHEVKIARFAPSADVSYAMFTGGGMAYADEQMKAGRYEIKPGPVGARPDLSGLSCRFEEIPAERGVILSLIVVPARPTDDPQLFREVIEDLVSLAESGAGVGRPVPVKGPGLRWPPSGLSLEARASRGTRSLWREQILLGLKTLAAFAVFKTGRPVAGFSPARYVRELVQNTDFRKFDDGLRMTLDCTPTLVAEIEQRLAQARSLGIVRFGLERQSAALMTCFVPSPINSDHVHFVDGAAGGYAAAARALKRLN